MTLEDISRLLFNKDAMENSLNKKMMTGIIIKQVLNHLKFDAVFQKKLIRSGIVDINSNLFAKM